MWINNEDKWLFISTPKAGTHTMYALLEGYGGVQQGMSGSRNHCNQIPAHAHDFFKFTIVRNPYERAVASWFHLLHSSENMSGRMTFREKAKGWMDGDSFQDFTKFLLVRHKHIKPTQPMMFNGQHEWHNGIQFHEVLKLETLAADIHKLPFISPDQTVPQLYSFANERKPWQEFYTKDDWDRVAEAYQDDFEVFGYDTLST